MGEWYPTGGRLSIAEFTHRVKKEDATRPWTFEELAAIREGAEAPGLSAEEALAQLGDMAVDVYLNDVAYWRGVPSGVSSYTIRRAVRDIDPS